MKTWPLKLPPLLQTRPSKIRRPVRAEQLRLPAALRELQITS